MIFMVVTLLSLLHLNISYIQVYLYSYTSYFYLLFISITSLLVWMHKNYKSYYFINKKTETNI